MRKKKKRTITGTHFVGETSDSSTDIRRPTYPIPEGRKYIMRMGWDFHLVFGLK